MKIITIKWMIGILNSIALAFIVCFFIMSLIYSDQGVQFILYSTGWLIFIGVLFVIVHFLERRSETFQFALSKLHRYLSVTIKVLLVIISLAMLAVSIVFFIVSGNSKFLLNIGCLIAFIMIIILIELFIRILLPLAGVDQSI